MIAYDVHKAPSDANWISGDQTLAGAYFSKFQSTAELLALDFAVVVVAFVAFH